MKKIFKNKNVNRVILALLVIVVLMDCFCSSARFKTLVDETYESQIQAVAEIVVEQQNDEISVIVGALKDRVKTLANVVVDEGVPTNEDIKRHLEAIGGSTYGDVIIANKDGQAMDAYGNFYDISKKKYFKTVMGGETVVSETTVSAKDGDNVIIVAAPMEYKGECVGAVCCVLRLETISEIIEDDFMSEIGHIILVQSDGKVIASTRDDVTLGEEIGDNAIFVSEVGEDNARQFMQRRTDTSGDEKESASGDVSHIGRGDNSYVSEIYNEESGWTLVSIINTEKLENYSEELNEDILRYMISFIARIFAMIVLFVIVLLNDIRIVWGEKKELEQQKDIMEFKALHDPMTGLYNKARFMYLAEKEIKDNPFGKHALYFIDVDDFKHYNDTYGHAAGDELLKGFAEVLKSTFRNGDFIARYGGDEFVVMVNDYFERANLIALADRLYDNTGKKEFKSFDEKITLSVGIAEMVPGATFEGIMHCADEALYKSKENGKNQYTFAD